jgi:hypothetical protein
LSGLKREQTRSKGDKKSPKIAMFLGLFWPISAISGDFGARFFVRAVPVSRRSHFPPVRKRPERL